MKKKYKSRMIAKEVLLEDILYGGQGLISDDIIDHGRWSIHHDIVFEYQDKFYTTSYSVGATEQQDESPWEYDGEWITCYECVPKEITIVEYERILEDEK